MTLLEILRPLTSHNAQQRGWQYLNRVHTLAHDAQSVTAEVQGSGEVYDVEIRTDLRHLRVWCSCPYFADRSSGCKHLWATAVLATENGWLTAIPAPIRVVMDFAGGEDLEFGLLDDRDAGTSQALVRPALDTPAAPPDWAVALAAVTPSVEGLAPASGSGAPLIYVLTVPPRATVTDVAIHIEQVEPRRDGAPRTRPSTLTLDAIPHLPDADDRWALALVHAAGSGARPSAWPAYGVVGQRLGPTHVNGPMLDVLLPRLCDTGRVRLRTAHRNVPSVAQADADTPLRWDAGEAWRFVLVVTADVETHEGREGREGREGQTGSDSHEGVEGVEGRGGEAVAAGPVETKVYRVDALLERGGVRVGVHQFTLLTDTIAILDHVAARFDPAGGFAWAAQLRARGALVIPAHSHRALVESLARSAVEQVELPDDLRWEDRAVPPRFGVTIGRPDEISGSCPIELLAHYGDAQAPLVLGSSRLLSDDGRVMYRRGRAAETEALETLRALGIVNVDAHLRQGASIHYRKVPGLVRTLVDADWIVLAEGLRYRALDTPRLRISSGIDWFEIKTLSETGTAVDLRDLLEALKTGRRTVALGDGTVGMLPEQWLARIAPVLALGEADASGVRFKPSQVALIDALLAAQPNVDWDEGFERARAAILRFDGVRPEDAPATFRGELRDYQRESLGWMRFLRDFGFGGCLADDMGLGKTVMVLAMLEARRTDVTRPPKPSLVVMPRSLIFNWTSEAARFAPGLRIMDFAHAERHGAIDAMAHADLVFTTYGTLRRDIATLQNLAFDYVVLDEAQAIKNAGTATAKAVRLLRADHRLALTGTPIENHLAELYSLFEFLNPGLLGSGRVLDARRLAGGADSPGYMARLATGLRPFFLRRTKEHVTPELPSRTEETLYCELEGEQHRTYEQLRQHYRATLLKKIDRDGLVRSRFEILEALLRLRQAACHTELLPGRIAGHSAKFDLLLPRLGELVAEGRKALVFSQFTSLLALLRQRLDADKIAHEYLDGKTRDREAHVARFQDDPSCSLFLLSLKAGGVGLNLTAAEYVFLLDPWWNPAVEMQAIDRTHRIGQLKPVFAYRLVARETVEERILELQAHKRALADAILDAGTGGLRGLQREDLEQLLA
jgi:superfamily II DNA or RNA helicase